MADKQNHPKKTENSEEMQVEEEERENGREVDREVDMEREGNVSDGHEEEESDAYAIIPPNGGWGWVVVVCAFYCNVIVDGIQLTFGVFLYPISKSLGTGVAEVALAGSLMFGIHLLMGPICAAFSKVFGLRPVAIIGALICCFGVGISYFATGNWYLNISFGVIGGIGLGLVYMNSLVITSVYFTTLLPVAIAIVVCGTGVGTMVFAALGNCLLAVTSWQNSFLIEAALAGSMALAAISFKPLKPVNVEVASPETESVHAANEGEPSFRRKTVFVRTVGPGGKTSISSLHTMNSLIWNLMEEAVVSNPERQQENKRKCNCLRCKKKKTPLDKRTLVLSEIKPDPRYPRRRSYIEKEKLQEYKKEETLPVGRIHSKGSVFTRLDLETKQRKAWDAIKKTIWAIVDCHLLASCPFVMFTISGALQVAGFVIVFMYEKERCTFMGFSDDMSVYFVIFLGGANMFWRLLLGGLATLPKVKYWLLAILGIIIGGLAATFSGFSSNVYFQFGFCFFFGLGIASFAVFRMVLLVDLVGVKKIENATGINLLFMGVLCIICPPFFGWLKELTNSYDIVFILTGILIVISGMMLIGLQRKKIES